MIIIIIQVKNIFFIKNYLIFFLFEEWRCYELNLNVEMIIPRDRMFPFLEFCLFIEFEHCFMVIYACKYIKLAQECILNISVNISINYFENISSLYIYIYIYIYIYKTSS
jgi:hypothetical protein